MLRVGFYLDLWHWLIQICGKISFLAIFVVKLDESKIWNANCGADEYGLIFLMIIMSCVCFIMWSGIGFIMFKISINYKFSNVNIKWVLKIFLSL